MTQPLPHDISQAIKNDVSDHIARGLAETMEACKYGWLSYIPHRIGVRLSHWRHCILLWIWLHSAVYLRRHPDCRPEERRFLKFSIEQYALIQQEYGRHLRAMLDKGA